MRCSATIVGGRVVHALITLKLTMARLSTSQGGPLVTDSSWLFFGRERHLWRFFLFAMTQRFIVSLLTGARRQFRHLLREFITAMDTSLSQVHSGACVG